MGKSSSPTGTLALLGKLRQQPRVPLAKRGRRQLGCRYLRQQGSDGCWQSPVGKGNDIFANILLCQQHGPKLLAKPTRASGGSPALPTAWTKAVGKAGKAGGESPALAHAVGKAGNFPPFLLLLSSI
jgi:hypothetical protein